MSDVEITLGSGDTAKTETLRCTLRAAKRVNAGVGFAEILRKLAVFDQDAYVAVVAAGLDKKPADVENAVFDAGLTNLTEPLSEYVALLANGGRPVKTAETGGTGEA